MLDRQALRQAAPQVVIGTAGHVDHGKSSLVRALTGTDPDRLPEEKARGMTIELGFAFLAGEGCDLAFIDCPGHERFIVQMVAGSGSIDGSLLIVAADEGPREQTREHLDVLRLLGMQWGRVVVTKADLVDAATLAATIQAITALVAGTVLAEHPPLPVSVRNGRGLPELRRWLLDQAQHRRQPEEGAHVRLPIDRVFTVAGIGTVVTGTLHRGMITVGDALELFPGGAARVRSLQVNHQAVDRAIAGQRTAVNLVGIDRAAVTRGAWLATPASLHPTAVADVRLEILPIGVRHRQLVEVFHGTTLARGHLHLLHAEAQDGGVADAQLRLATPLYLRPHDRVIIRRPTPSANLAGAVVVDAAPPRHRRFSEAARRHFAALLSNERERLLGQLAARWPLPLPHTELVAWAGGPGPAEAMLSAAMDAVIQRCLGRKQVLFERSGFTRALDHVHAAVVARHRGDAERCWWSTDQLRPLLWPTMPVDVWEDLIAAAIATGQLVRHAGLVSVPAAVPAFPTALVPEARRLLGVYRAAAMMPPYDHPVCAEALHPPQAERALSALRERGYLVRINDRLHLHRDAASRLVAEVAAAVQAGDGASIAADLPGWMKTRFALSRKYTVPFCDWLDTQGVTQRQGERRTAGTVRTLTTPLLGEPVS